MILDEIKSLIKDFEKCLIKDDRFKKDYKFKNQVRTISSCNKSKPNQIIVPVPYFNGTTCTNEGSGTGTGTSTGTSTRRQSGLDNSTNTDNKWDLKTFVPEEDLLELVVDVFDQERDVLDPDVRELIDESIERIKPSPNNVREVLALLRQENLKIINSKKAVVKEEIEKIIKNTPKDKLREALRIFKHSINITGLPKEDQLQLVRDNLKFIPKSK